MVSRDPIGDELTAWGKVALLETRGRLSGRSVTSAVGFIAADDGSLLVAAGEEGADWALNLRHDPRCKATVGETLTDYEATELTNDERARVITALILKYGTPAERLGRGPAFRLSPRPLASS